MSCDMFHTVGVKCFIDVRWKIGHVRTWGSENFVAKRVTLTFYHVNLSDMSYSITLPTQRCRAADIEYPQGFPVVLCRTVATVSVGFSSGHSIRRWSAVVGECHASSTSFPVERHPARPGICVGEGEYTWSRPSRPPWKHACERDCPHTSTIPSKA